MASCYAKEITASNYDLM